MYHMHKYSVIAYVYWDISQMQTYKMLKFSLEK